MSSSPIYYPPYSSSILQFATEEEQIQLAKRIGLIQHLPTGIYDECSSNGSTKAIRECVICMVEFSKGDSIRFLPCLHTYHVHCIDDWLMRSFICPSCMEPVDVALLNTLWWNFKSESKRKTKPTRRRLEPSNQFPKEPAAWYRTVGVQACERNQKRRKQS